MVALKVPVFILAAKTVFQDSFTFIFHFTKKRCSAKYFFRWEYCLNSVDLALCMINDSVLKKYVGSNTTNCSFHYSPYSYVSYPSLILRLSFRRWVVLRENARLQSTMATPAVFSSMEYLFLHSSISLLA